jgi:hypothetical protein
MSQVLDYSAGFPGARAIKQAGYAGAVRYIGQPGRGKNTSRGELDDFSANDIGMALVFEQLDTDWQGGLTQGLLSGRRARDHATAIGFPADRPIYMAVDHDLVQAGEFSTMVKYLRGASSSLGGVHLTGVYGEADVIDRARDAGVAEWFWQTAAWSRGRRTEAHLYQRIGTVYVGGIGCDVNDVLQDDWGQHNYKGGGVSKQDVFEALQDKYPNLGGRNIPDALAEVLNRILHLTDSTMPALSSTVTGMAVNLQALKDKPNAEITAEDIAAVTAQFQEAADHAFQGAFEVNITRRQEIES